MPRGGQEHEGPKEFYPRARSFEDAWRRVITGSLQAVDL